MSKDGPLKFHSISREPTSQGLAVLMVTTPTGRIRKIPLWSTDLLKIAQQALRAMESGDER